MQIILPNMSRIKILLRHKWNVYQNLPYAVSSSKSQEIWMAEIIQNVFPDHSVNKLEINNWKIACEKAKKQPLTSKNWSDAHARL